jgi:hydrogenase nickel incorporation protein HypA/HybF
VHELTVAMQICDALDRELVGDDPDTSDVPIVVDVVRVQVGALSGIVPGALRFAWPHAVGGTPLLASATLDIDLVDASVGCESCGATTNTPELTRLRCPLCGSPQVQVRGGHELDIISVDIREVSGRTVAEP